MKEEKAPKRERRVQKAASIEKYNSRTDRKTSQNGSVLFSAFVFSATFLIVFGTCRLVFGDASVWTLGGSLLAAVLASMSIHIALQWEKVVVLRLGKYSRTKGPGVYFTIPIFEQVALVADQRVMLTGFGAEATLTSDLVPINVDAVLFWMVWDAEKAALEVENYYNSVSLVAQTALRDAIGRASASEVAVRRNQLDEELQEVIEEKTSQWGITILSVEIRDIVIPESLQEAMSAEAQAEREKNARMVLAEVEKDISSMLVEAADQYKENDIALRLRTMHLLYESVKSSGGTVVIPSAYCDGFSDSALEKMVDATRWGLGGHWASLSLLVDSSWRTERYPLSHGETALLGFVGSRCALLGVKLNSYARPKGEICKLVKRICPLPPNRPASPVRCARISARVA